MNSTLDMIISFCPTGMLPTKLMTPHVPILVSEIVDEVLEAAESGITMVHLHARDEKSGAPTWRASVYENIILGIRKYNKDLVICVSTSGRDFPEFEKRSDVLNLTGDAKPDMASLTLGSLNFSKRASLNPPEIIQKLAARMTEKGILPELEAFDIGMINYAKYLCSKALIKPPFYINLILGNIASAQADLLQAGLMVRELPASAYWSFGGIGNTQFKMNMLGLIGGGGIRIGLEDNIWLDDSRSILATNMDLLNRVYSIAEASDRRIMTPQKLRNLLKLEPGQGLYAQKVD